jgi:GAF domain-containing protein
MMQSNPSPAISSNPEEVTRLLYRNWREKFVTPLLIGTLILGAFVLIPAVNSAGSIFIKAVFITTYVLTGIVTLVPFTYNIRISVLLLGIYALGLSELMRYGILGDSTFFFLGSILFATLLLSPRVGILVMAVNILTITLSGWLMLNKTITPLAPFTFPAIMEDWLSSGGMVVMFGMVIILGFQRLEKTFLETQQQIDDNINTIKNERNNLEKIVSERTEHLHKVNKIGRTITTILNPDELLSRAVSLIGDEFDCYYTAIFLTDTTGQWADLKVATGDAGKVLQKNKYHLSINGKNAVSTAMRTNQACIADNGPDFTHNENPLLPYTRSQIALPIAIGERVIGALEMHSTKQNVFSPQDADTFQNMANQVAIALENSRLFAEAQQSINEMSATQQQYIQGGWLSLTTDQKFEYSLGEKDLTDRKNIEVPLTLREQVIGQINMSGMEEWTPEQKKLIESIASQAALALENARLVEESQSIAMRERLANEVTSKIWASTTLDSILQTTVRELGRALEAAEVNIEVFMDGDHE